MSAPRLIGLLRGVNVGGGNRLPMAEFRASLEAAGFEGVRTYIQSGNVVFENTDNARERMAGVLKNRFGLDVPVLILSFDAMRAVRAALPFDGPGNRIMFGLFLEENAAQNADLARLLEVAEGDEDAVLHDAGVILNLPQGQAASRMAAELEKRLGALVTARNLNTVDKLIALAET